MLDAKDKTICLCNCKVRKNDNKLMNKLRNVKPRYIQLI